MEGPPVAGGHRGVAQNPPFPYWDAPLRGAWGGTAPHGGGVAEEEA